MQDLLCFAIDMSQFQADALTPDPSHHDCPKINRTLRLRDGGLKDASCADEKSFDIEYFDESAGH